MQYLRYLLLILAPVLLVACGTPEPVRDKQVVDGLTIVLERPPTIKQLREEQLVIILIAADDRTINGATVSLDLVMPEMAMGQNRPLADPLGGGRYRVKTTYTMAGVWKVGVDVLLNGKKYHAVFDQQVQEN